MPWFKVSDSKPCEGEQVLINRGVGSIELRRYTSGRWYVEDSDGGSLSEAEGVTHWAPLLDSEEYDPAED